MRETKFSLGLAIAISVTLVTSASVGSVLAAGYVNPAGGAAGNMTAAGGAAGNMTKAGNMTAAGGAAGNTTKAPSNATSSNSSNPLAKIGQALSGLFGGKK